MLREPPANGFDSLDPANGFGSDDSIRAFGFGLGGGADIEIDSSGDVVVIPDAAFLFNADFHRDGRDLLITGDDGRRVVVHDYFAGDKRPALASREGATIAGHVVEAIVRQTSPTEVAQAGGQPANASTPIGRVEKVSGIAFVIRNGVPVNLNAGDLVFKGDVVQTGAGSSIGIGFVDGSAFNLAANARMVLNEMVYDPNGTSNSALVSLVQGSISFLAGQVAKTGDMKVETPVATMGIRGTIVLVEITANNGPTKVMSVFDPTTGRVGEVVFWEKNNLSNVIGRLNTQDTALLITPTGTFQVVVTQVPVTDSDRLAAQEVVRTVVDINAAMLANPLVPGLPGTQPPGPPGPSDGSLGTPGGVGGSGGGGGGSGGTPDPLPNLGSTGGTTTTASFTPGGTPFTIPGSTIPTPTVVSGGGGGGGGGGTAGGTGTGTGGNAPPVLSPDATPSHTPTGASGGGSGPAQAGGSLTFTDPDAGDTHQAAVSAGSAQWTRADNSPVGTAIPPATLAALGTALAITAVDSAAGTVQWSFSLAQEAAWFLAEGERLAVTYTVTVTDAAGETSTQPVTIVIVGTNDGPVFLGGQQTGATEDGETLTVVGEALFADADLSDIHGVAAAPDPATPNNIGTLIAGVLHDTTGAGTGGVVGWAYQADQDAVRALAAGEVRTDSFVLTLADSHGATTTRTVAVTLVGENDAPEVSGAVAGTATEDAGPVALDAFANATDADHGATLQVVDVPAALPAGVTFDAATHSFTLDPSHPAYQSLAAGATTVVTVHYGVSDGFVTTPATAQWTVTGTNDAPTAAADAATVADGSPPAAGNLLANDTDPDGPLHVTAVESDANQTAAQPVEGDPTITVDGTYGRLVVVKATGEYTYTLWTEVDGASTSQVAAVRALGPDDSVQESFTYTVADDHGATATADLTVTVNGKNDAPTVTGTPQSATLVEAGTPGFTPNTGTFTAYIDLTIGDPDAGDSAAYDLSGWGDFDPVAAGAVQWTVANGGNGHWYKYVSDPLVWADARQAALNERGYLANVTSLTENDFIHSLKGGEVAWLGGSDDGHEGIWQWADGPEAGSTFSIGNSVQTGFFANWWGSEPNNAGAGEHYVYIDGNKAWTDVAGTLVEPASFGANGYVVEFSYSKRGTYGWASFDPTTGRVTYTLDNGDPDTQALKATDVVEDIFDIVVTDGEASTTFQAKFKIQGQNDAPDAVDDAREVDAGSASVPTIRGILTGNDTDPEDDFLVIHSISHGETDGQFGPGGFTVDGTYGRLFVEPDSTYSYTLWTNVPGASESQIAAVTDIPPGETRVDTFDYVISDGDGAQDEAELAVTVNGPPPSTNHAPAFAPASHMEIGPAVLVSRDADGDPGTNQSTAPSFSGDGSRIAFSSYADLIGDETNLTGDDSTPGGDDSDIIVRMTDGSLVRASTSASGAEADGDSFDPVLSPDGTKVAFWSYATNLIDGEDDTNETADIFIKDLATGVIERLTNGLDGEPDAGSFRPRFSPDGSKIAFWSYAGNLVANDENGEADVFVVDLATKDITRWSIGDEGQEADRFSTDPEFSPDGTRLVFVSRAENLVDGDTNDGSDIFIRELTAGGSTIRVSTASDGSQAENPDSEGSVNSGDPVFSPDGTKVAFASDADNLVDGDANGATDIFVKDLVTGAVVRVNTSSHGVEARNGYSVMPVFSPDGTRIAFVSNAGNLVPGDHNGVDDVFVKDLATGAIIRVSDGDLGAGFSRPVFTPDGRIAFSALSLEGNASGPREQVFVAPLADVEGGPVTDYVVDDPTAGTLTTGGRLRFADPDAGDTHTVGLFPADGNLGTLTPVAGTDEAGNPVVDWTYTVPQSAARGLDQGETRVDRFTVRVTDSHGAQADQAIEITIHGTNAAPQVEGDKVVAFAEDAAGPVPLHIAPAFDFDGDPIQIVVDTVPEPSFGEIRKANGTPLAVGQILLASELAGLTFTPGAEPDFDPAVFTYHAVDEHGTESEPSTVRLEQVATTTAGRTVDFDDIDVNPPGDTDGELWNLSIPNGYGDVGHFPGFFWNFFGVLGDVYPSYSEPNSAYGNSSQFVSSISSRDGSEFVVNDFFVARLSGATSITITAIDMGHVVGTLTVDLSSDIDFSNVWHRVQPNFGPVTQLHIQAEGFGNRQWQLDDFAFTTVPTFAGNFGNDVLFGGAANESFHGNSGNDTITGSAGGDTLNGGQGRDLLDGGADGDIYKFFNVFESGYNDAFDGGATADAADVIASFVQDEDAIDLSIIDADTSDTFNDDFLWGGDEETTDVLNHGVTWYTDAAHNRTVIQVENNGDGAADMTIVLAGVMNLRAADFFGLQGL